MSDVVVDGRGPVNGLSTVEERVLSVVGTPTSEECSRKKETATNRIRIRT